MRLRTVALWTGGVITVALLGYGGVYADREPAP